MSVFLKLTCKKFVTALGKRKLTIEIGSGEIEIGPGVLITQISKTSIHVIAF